MSVGSGRAHESTFGPPSALIDISEFLKSANNLEASHPCHLFTTTASSIAGNANGEWINLPSSERDRIQEECRIDNIQKELHNVVDDPALYNHVMNSHETAVHSIYESTETSNRRKRKRVTIASPARDSSSVDVLKEKIEATQLKSWPLSLSSALFIRTPKQADHNTLTTIKQIASASDTTTRQAVLFITVFNPLGWGHRQIARGSQHAVLSSQTLDEFLKAIPCPYHRIPESTGESEIADSERDGALACIEGALYAGGQNQGILTSNLLERLQRLEEQNSLTLSNGFSMEKTVFASLSVKLQTPYWLVHSGDCEHYFIIDQIRLYHPHDPPPEAFPLTTQITPPLLDNCRACCKVPAVYSIVGDMRLGESPFLICGPCWKWMGLPTGDNATSVSVVELPKFDVGWTPNISDT